MQQVFTIGSLFAGIGGLDYGLERTGRFHVVWQVEIDPYCQRVLAKHWPDVTGFRDVRDCGRHNLSPVDVLASGFPCQPHSLAGKRRHQPMSATCRVSLRDLFASLDRAMCWRKMFQGYVQVSLDGSLVEFCETWLRAGMMRNGNAYRRSPLVRHILENESFLWPTPTVTNSGSGRINMSTSPQATPRPTLAMMARKNLWPTPRATDGNHGGPNAKDSSGNYALSGAVHHWPTPTARDWRSGKSSAQTHECNSRPLNERAAQGQISGQLNPMWVEWLMGFPLGWTDCEG